MAGLVPLPSFLRASSQDAADMQMRAAGRTRWNDDDWNLNAETLERLTRATFGRPSDHNDQDMCFIRFQQAERAERRGELNSRSTADDFARAIAA